MSTIACPGCGMPRAVELFDEKPCPVCDTVLPMAGEIEPEFVTSSERSPAAARLPADASELAAYPMPRLPMGWVAVGLLVGFSIGAMAGAGGLYAWQSDFRFSQEDPTETAAAVPVQLPSPEPPPQPQQPDSHPPAQPEKSTSNYSPPSTGPETVVVPQPMGVPPPAGQAVVIEVNEPNGEYSLPFPTVHGEHVILKGRAKSLKLAAVDGGASVDASGLVAAEIVVDRVDGNSTVKLNAPEGQVTFAGKVDGKSTVVVHAPGGLVRFPNATVTGQAGSKIDGSSRVSITAKRVELRGDINGQATRVTVVLTRAGALRVATVQGTAVLEYRMENSGWSISDVTVGPTAPGATVRDVSPSDAAIND